jgi:hypothetical protein
MMAERAQMTGGCWTGPLAFDAVGLQLAWENQSISAAEKCFVRRSR